MAHGPDIAEERVPLNPSPTPPARRRSLATLIATAAVVIAAIALAVGAVALASDLIVAAARCARDARTPGAGSGSAGQLDRPDAATAPRASGDPPPGPMLLDLSGPTGPAWALSNANGSVDGIRAAVPGYALGALRRAVLLGAPPGARRSDPLYRFNDLEFEWVAMDTWTFATEFALPPSLRSAPRSRCGLDLVLGGVDTAAEVRLDGQTVAARLQNFHRSYRLDVRHLLTSSKRAGATHRLEVQIAPAVPYIREQMAAHPYPIPTNKAVGAYGNFAFIRKPGSDMGWDWGPALAPAGLHGDVRLVSYCAPYVAGLHVLEQRHNATPEGGVRLRLEAEVWLPPGYASGDPATDTDMYDTDIYAQLTGPSGTEVAAARRRLQAAAPTCGVDGAGSPGGEAAAATGDETEEGAEEQGEARAGQGPDAGLASALAGGANAHRTRFVRLAMDVPPSQVQLWWPVGFGPQPLYTLAAWAQPAWGGGAGAGGGGAAGAEAGEGEGQGAGEGKARRRARAQARSSWAGGGAAGAEAVGSSSSEEEEEEAVGVEGVEEEAAEEEEAAAGGRRRGARAGAGAGVLTWHPAPGASGELPLRRRVGLRTVEVVTVPPEQAFGELTDQRGLPPGPPRPFPAPPNETLYFRVNGQPLYARGANLIPLAVLHVDRDWYDPEPGADFDPLSYDNPDPAGPPAIARVLAAALRAGMNMIRVWGGGRYQLDAMYDMADEAGLLMWQEFMFACNPYPNTPLLRAEVAAEAAQQVRRLAGHPSVVLWGGNNEVEASFRWYKNTTRVAPALYAADYTALFVDGLRGVLLRLDPSRPYLDSSPSNGLWSTAPFVKRWGDTRDPAAGDVHFYDYRNDCLDPDNYPRARFVSEYGYQSYASVSAVRPYGEDDDWAPLSNHTRHRQRHKNGEPELLASLLSHFKRPRAGWGAGASFEAWVYQTQVQQALCYSTALGLWRSLRSHPEVLNMGVLYWQLNDIWPGYSWSSLDHGGARKPLHSALARALAPLGVAARVEGGNVTVYVINDAPTDAFVRLTVSAVSLAAAPPSPPKGGAGGEQPEVVAVFTSLRLTAPAQRSLLALSAPARDALAALPACRPATCVLHARLTRLPDPSPRPGSGSRPGGTTSGATGGGRSGGGGGGSSGGGGGGGSGGGGAWPWGGGAPAADEARLLDMAAWERLLEGGGGEGREGARRLVRAAEGEGQRQGREEGMGLALLGRSGAGGGGGGEEEAAQGDARADAVPVTAAAAGSSAAAAGGGGEVADALVMLVAPRDLLLSQPNIEVYDITYDKLPPPAPTVYDTVRRRGPVGSGAAAGNSGGGGSGGNGEGRWCFSLRANSATALLVTLESDLAGDFGPGSGQGEAPAEGQAFIHVLPRADRGTEGPGGGEAGRGAGGAGGVLRGGEKAGGRGKRLLRADKDAEAEEEEVWVEEGEGGGEGQAAAGAEARGGRRVCFYERRPGPYGPPPAADAEAFRGALRVRELWGMQR